MYSKKYQQIAYDVFKLKRECCICGSVKKLVVHHIDRDHDNNSKENLIVLCGACHKRTHINSREMGEGLKRDKDHYERIVMLIMYNQGDSVPQIASTLGYTNEGVWYNLNKCGVYHSKPTKVTDDIIMVEMTCGLSLRKIAEKYGVSHTCIIRRLKKLKDRNRVTI